MVCCLLGIYRKTKKILLVELGPGDGSLCKDLLKIFKQFKNFYNSLEIILLEISDKLKTVQKVNINNKKVKIIKKINVINNWPISFLGNEFFDALPIKQIYKKKKLFFEKHVALSSDNKKIRFLHKKANNNLIKRIKDLNLTLGIPVIFGVLTDNSEQQAINRSGGKNGNKGVEAAITAIKMAYLNK